jgi:short-subunit dehydrogenase
MTPKRRVLITGASSGIGEACAREWARRGWNLVLTARRSDRLEALAQALATEHGCEAVVLAVDLADPLAPVQLVDALVEHGLHIDGLINNAGYGVPGNYLSVPWRTHADFLRVLLWAPTELSYLLLPGMRERGYGRIVNVASLAGLVPPTAGHTLYGATKSYLIRFSQSLAQEVASAGIHVTALCPGFTYTEFHDVNGMRSRVSQLPRYLWMDAATVAREAFEAVEAGRVVHIPGRINRVLAGLAKYLPEPLALALTQRQARKFRHSGSGE